MKRFTALLTLLLMAGTALAGTGATLTLPVLAPDNSPVAGAQVIAIAYGANGPIASSMQIATSGSDGTAAFSAGNSNTLALNTTYFVYASSQGYTPTIRDQFNGYTPQSVYTGDGSAQLTGSAITLTAAPGVFGEIDGNITGASNTGMLMGEIHPTTGVDASIAYGFCQPSGGTCTMKFLNVPPSSANTYQIKVVDPNNGNPVQAPVIILPQALSAGQTITGTVSVSGGLPPSTVNNNTGNASSGIAVAGSVVDASNTSTPIPYGWMNVSYIRNDQYCSNCVNSFGAGIDNTGHFTLNNLQTNTSYYVQLGSMCNGQTDICYTGSSNAAFSANPSTTVALGTNDFFYGSTPETVTVKLAQATGGNATLPVYLINATDSKPLPIQAQVNIGPDYWNWHTNSDTNCSNATVSNPGLYTGTAQATTGYALLSHLPSGNYTININSSMSSSGLMYAGHMCGSSGNCTDNCNSSDLRLTIDTAAAATDGKGIKIYDAKGNLVSSGATLTIPITIPTNTSGVVHGTLTFPQAADLSNDPVNITLQPQCTGDTPCSGGGFTSINYTATDPRWYGSAKIDYSVNVSSGQPYWLQITSGYWGVVYSGNSNNMVNLSISTSATVNYTMARAGRVTGSLYTPAGIYTPPAYSGVNINLNGNNSWAYSNVAQDGSYVVGGLLPGKFQFQVSAWGTFPYAMVQNQPPVTVTAGHDTQYDLHMTSGVNMLPKAGDFSKLPRLRTYNCSGDNNNKCPPQRWAAITVPRGKPLISLATDILNDKDNAINMTYGMATQAEVSDSNFNQCSLSHTGFCPTSLAAPAAYDVYLTRLGEMDAQHGDDVWPYFVVVTSSQNVVVNSSAANDYQYISGSTLAVVDVDLTPAQDESAQSFAVLAGSITGVNIIRQQDFTALGGDFDNFLTYLPILSLYDSNNTLVGAAQVMPDPAAITQSVDTAIQTYVAQGDWTDFYNLFNTTLNGSWGCQLRGLTPGATYTAVLTSRNYPPYQTTVSMGVAGSTTTMTVNLDTAVGSGLTISGTVADSNGTAIANALVTLAGTGVATRSFTTASDGKYQFPGLAQGTYIINATAQGYVASVVKAAVTATTAKDFSLATADASISGTVYSQRVPYLLAQPGANVYAYDDTLNLTGAELPLYAAVTSSVGYYSITGLKSADNYRIFVKYPDKYVQNTEVMAVVGDLSGTDFYLQDKPLDIQVFGRVNSTLNTYEFTFLNPDKFSGATAWIGPALNFSTSTATKYTNSQFQQLPNNQMALEYPLSGMDSSSTYRLHVEAQAALFNQTVTKDMDFGLSSAHANSLQAIDDKLIGDTDASDTSVANGVAANQAVLGAGDLSGISMPPGSIIPVSTFTIPSMTMVSDSSGTVTAPTGAQIDGSVYTISISSVNLTDRGFDLTLAYDMANANIAGLTMYHYNSSTGEWEPVTGTPTIDTVNGTVTMRIKSLSNPQQLSSSDSRHAMTSSKGYAARTGVTVLNDSGKFAMMNAASASNAYSGGVLKVYNFPNPFNLDAKTLTVNNDGNTASVTTNGTVIKCEIPGGVSGNMTIKIYTLAGELVKELSLGSVTGGNYVYTTWDGRNSRGAKVADGVYYGMLHVDNVNLNRKDATFKMAVVK
jgi:hypothetical protein